MKVEGIRFRSLQAALAFLTRFPVGVPAAGSAWRWASVWFPAVGAVLGILLGLVWQLTAPLPELVRGLLTVLAGALLTGALHEDGLADTADALGGARGDRNRALAIMKDPAIGTYGALALVASIALRGVTLAELGGQILPWLVLVHAFSRLAPVWIMAWLPYVTAPERARSGPVTQTGVTQAVAASGVALTCGALALLGVGEAHWGRAALSVAVAAAVTCVAGVGLRRWIGGFTGDTMGAVQQSCECAMLVALVAL